MNVKRKEYAEDEGPIDAACGCLVCRRYSRAYLRHLFVAGETLGATLNSVHNLAVLSGYDEPGSGGAGWYPPSPVLVKFRIHGDAHFVAVKSSW